MELINEFYSKLPWDKVQINWNKNPIRMGLFLSFLTVPVEIIRDHLGSDTGWTMKENKEHKLIIRGGIVNGIEWLDSLQFGTKLSNPYNNYVNPFFLMDIMTKEGIYFFLEYYKKEIDQLIENQIEKVESHKRQLEYNAQLLKDMNAEIQKIKTFK